jgi:SanA protein
MIFTPLLILTVLFCFFIMLLINTRSRIYDFENVPFCRYTLVLGAGLEKNGLATDILSDRVLKAANLIKNKKTDFLILSGSSNYQNHSEPLAMKTYAESLGVDSSKLILDNEGKTTFDSILNLNRLIEDTQIVIVSQNFHLPRAIWLAEAAGFRVCGVPANIFKFSIYKILFWYLREVFALPVNLLKLLLNRFRN